MGWRVENGDTQTFLNPSSHNLEMVPHFFVILNAVAREGRAKTVSRPGALDAEIKAAEVALRYIDQKPRFGRSPGGEGSVLGKLECWLAFPY